ncbi:hypothetical protein O4J56_17940 [Nocardiopsis sp. RSe5-2]|uniref:Uncharacterized protein n=1 Tax=Nocardiopsis endophytica TaxID=3018445 RepID=A0ABT4U6G3_9ACTN|nr:hypothetical protein [Nocardiopsis endophytica]MDA2812530.1 hypothetical protein [Nocardiopsis endophytica]
MDQLFGDLDLLAAAGAEAADVTVAMDESVDAPTTVPCGITISITLDC